MNEEALNGLRAIFPELPPAALEALNREITAQARLWLRLPELYEEGLKEADGPIPELFKGVRGQELFEGLISFVATLGFLDQG